MRDTPFIFYLAEVERYAQGKPMTIEILNDKVSSVATSDLCKGTRSTEFDDEGKKALSSKLTSSAQLKNIRINPITGAKEMLHCSQLFDGGGEEEAEQDLDENVLGVTDDVVAEEENDFFNEIAFSNNKNTRNCHEESSVLPKETKACHKKSSLNKIRQVEKIATPLSSNNVLTLSSNSVTSKKQLKRKQSSTVMLAKKSNRICNSVTSTNGAFTNELRIGSKGSIQLVGQNKISSFTAADKNLIEVSSKINVTDKQHIIDNDEESCASTGSEILL